MVDRVHVEVAWETDPLTRPAAMDWTRLGTVDPDLKLESLSTSRGVNIRTGDIETGTATALVGDQNGNLDPSNVLSEWAPNVLPRRRIRFVVDPDPLKPGVLSWGVEPLMWDGDLLVWSFPDPAETVLWTGYISSVPIQWRTAVQWTTLTAAGIFWLLAELSLPPSVLHVETNNTSPVGYWPMTESTGLIAEDVAGVADGRFRRLPTELATTVPFDDRPSIVARRPNAQDPSGQAMTAPIAPSSEMSVAVWFKWLGDRPESSTSPSVMYLSSENDPRSSVDNFLLMSVLMTSVGDRFVLFGFDGTNAAEVESAVVPVLDGAPHLLGFTVADDDEFHFYMDGAEVPVDTLHDPDLTGMDLPTVMASFRTLSFGWGITLTTGTDKNDAAVGHGGYWNRLLTEDEFADIYAAGTNPWAGDLTGARLNRILDLAGVDADDRDIAAGTQTCGPTALAGANVMDYIRKIAATEGGPVGEDAEGRIFLRDRTANDPTIAATFSDDPDGDDGTAVAPLDPDFSLDRVVNHCKVTRESGATQEAVAPASQATYGPKTLTLDTLHQSPSGSRSAAARQTIRNHDPRLVFPRVTADSIDTSADVMIGLDIGDACNVIARPPRGGDPIEQTSIVERVDHNLAAGESWKTTFGVVEHSVLPEAKWDTAGRGWDQSVVPA